MNRTLVIGDIHGGLRALYQIFERATITPSDKLIFLGDYIDGWSQSPQVIDFLIDLKTTHNCVFIRGNHDELLWEWFCTTNENLLWYQHGGDATVAAYENISDTIKKKHINFIATLENFYLDDKNRLFVHAGFSSTNGVYEEQFPKLFYWDRTLWETALSMDSSLKPNDMFYPKRLTLYSEIYIGHTPVTKINQTIPIQKASVWNIDTGAAFTGPLTVLDVNSKEFWQSDPLPYLYPNEKGRN